MPRYVALLRSVNVAGHGRIAMADLRASFDALGYDDVRTYIQTGNVLFSTSSKSEKAVAAAIEAQLASDFGDSPAVLLRTVAELQRVGRSSPYAKAGANPARHHVTFLATAPSKAALASLSPLPPSRNDELVVDGREVYVHTPGRLQRDEVQRQFPGAPARSGQHHEELEHGPEAVRAGRALKASPLESEG